jgi:hypothetical protein
MPRKPAMREVEHSISKDADFHAWLMAQADKLRSRRLVSLDCDDLAEELEAMARKDRLELRSRLQNLLSHLLKWSCEPSHRSKSWIATINELRDRIHDLLEESPSLKNELTALFAVRGPTGGRFATRPSRPKAKPNFRSDARGRWTPYLIPIFCRNFPLAN